MYKNKEMLVALLLVKVTLDSAIYLFRSLFFLQTLQRTLYIAPMIANMGKFYLSKLRAVSFYVKLLFYNRGMYKVQ